MLRKNDPSWLMRVRVMLLCPWDRSDFASVVWSPILPLNSKMLINNPLNTGIPQTNPLKRFTQLFSWNKRNKPTPTVLAPISMPMNTRSTVTAVFPSQMFPRINRRPAAAVVATTASIAAIVGRAIHCMHFLLFSIINSSNAGMCSRIRKQSAPCHRQTNEPGFENINWHHHMDSVLLRA